MPYIKGEFLRRDIDKIAKQLLKTGKITGNLNYFLFKLCKEYMKEEESYAGYKNFIGELEMAKLEIYRRLASKYEDQKIIENGDVE